MTFTRVVQRHASGAKSIDLELARPAVAEVRRSFDQMQAHHQAQMSTMGDDMKAMSHDDMKQPTSATKAMKMTMRQQMDTHMTALKERRTGAVGGRVQPFAH